MEIWDAYYKDGTKAGSDLVRGEYIPEGLYHLVCDILVRHRDGTYLLMQRDFNKKLWPGKLEASAGGSILKGETPIQGAIRELKEETGITATALERIYYTVSEAQHSIYYGFLCITDCKKDSIILQEGETIAYKWIGPEELIMIVDTDAYAKTQKERLKAYLEMLELPLLQKRKKVQ